MNAVLIGATRGTGRALARLLAARGDRIVLLGRNVSELQRSARDLEAHGAPPPVEIVELDLNDRAAHAGAIQRASAILGTIDTVIVTAAAFAVQEQLEDDATLLARVLDTDFTDTVLFCEAARKTLLAAGGGTLCVFSSVAGDRGRKPVILYGAAKAGLSNYLEGLDHKFRSHGLKVICVKPGFIRTSMTAGLKPPPFAADPEDVARVVLRGINKGTPVVYAPAVWQWVMLVIRNLPRFVMRRIGF
jgi:decaprenylphospho-beta-D-erythro-pentofuranosid-2-ulose 2-reductase